MKLKVKTNKRHQTVDSQGRKNGFLVPVYNIHEGFHVPGMEPQQVYLTVVAKGCVKGPHLHFIRTGCFTCIKGNVRIVLKTENGYESIYTGEAHDYRSVIVPTGIPAAIQNIGDEDAYVLNMPYPAWTPEMHDEHSADFSDFDFVHDGVGTQPRMIDKIRLSIEVGSGVRLRAATANDLETLRKWKNENRRFFFHQMPISTEQQQAWFAAFSQRTQDHLFLVELNGWAIGCMGIRWINKEWDVYNVILGDSAVKGKGFMSLALFAMLDMARDLMDAPTTLKVLKCNPAVGWYLKNGFVITHVFDDHYSLRHQPDSERNALT